MVHLVETLPFYLFSRYILVRKKRKKKKEREEKRREKRGEQRKRDYISLTCLERQGRYA